MIITKSERDEKINLQFISAQKGAVLLDVGCGDGSLINLITTPCKHGIIHHGVDIAEPYPIPNDLNFKKFDFDGNSLPYETEMFDLVYCSHVIEHLTNPLFLFSELCRVTKTNGTIILKAPSEKSVLGRSPFKNENRYFIANFYDDPTHIGRPWTPQSLLRLGSYHKLRVDLACYNSSIYHSLLYPAIALYSFLSKDTDKAVEYYWKKIGWETYARFTKTSSDISFNYKSFKGIPAFGDLNV